MDRISRPLRLGILAALGLHALALASVAQAGVFDLKASPAVVTGISEPQKLSEKTSEFEFTLTTPAGQIEGVCNFATFEGTTQGQIGVKEITVTPTYGKPGVQGWPEGGCFAGNPFVAPKFQMNGCKYTLTGEGQSEQTFKVDIVGCTAGKSMQITSPFCTLDIPEQNGLSHVAATNIGGFTEVTLQMTLAGITTIQTGAGCPNGNGWISTGLSFNGNTVVKAFNDSGSVQVTKHGHQYAEVVEGSQIGVTATSGA